MKPRRLDPPAAEWTRLLRVALGSGQVKALAIELQVSSSAVSQLLAGGRPSTETIARAEVVFGIPARCWLQPPKAEPAPPLAALTKDGLNDSEAERKVTGEPRRAAP